MGFSRPPHTGVKRALFRMPIWIYRLGLGGLLDGRFVLLTHIGRTSGQPRQAVLEIVGRHEESGGYLVASGYGSRSQWFRNILREPRVRFQVGWRHYTGTARPLPAAESGRRLADYARRYPRTAASLMRIVGQDAGTTPADYARVGADRDHGVPIVALCPDQRER
ncbi:nitroreductase family deazaflavin-dependent oxidoreductase [Salinactinospora qingdaonensis]|uniref:Nitroreductase family deazaflavin-dependent oxidoreductase n=1 Tax=Salinactinospora qingdaonensis TaxID=702744 RepID=A0ABP7FF54_9ACTN